MKWNCTELSGGNLQRLFTSNIRVL